MVVTIRILPMDKISEFKGWTSQKVQDKFFLNMVPSRILNREQGIYCFKTNKIKLDDKETYILFQFDNHIIACARLDKTISNELCNEYQGYYVLPPDTVFTFDKISLNDLNKHVFPQNSIKRFSQVCHKRTLSNIDSFLCNTKVVKNKKGVELANIIPNHNFQCKP